MSSTYLRDAECEINGVFAEMDADTKRFAASTGISCRESCGACCVRPGIEASVLEMLPAATELIAQGTADAWYDRAAADPSGPCIFYQAHQGDATRGRCQLYAFRPGLCRLFGYSAVRRKDGHAELASCLPHQEDHAAALASVNAALAAGAEIEVPRLGAYASKASMANARSGLGEIMSINAALMQAIERQSLSQAGDSSLALPSKA